MEEYPAVLAVATQFKDDDYNTVSSPYIFKPEGLSTQVYIRVVYVSLVDWKKAQEEEALAKEFGLEVDSSAVNKLGKLVPTFFDTEAEAKAFVLGRAYRIPGKDWNRTPRKSTGGGLSLD
jgi:transposase